MHRTRSLLMRPSCAQSCHWWFSSYDITSDIEESCEGRRKAGLVLVDLTAAYDTVWHQGLALKLLQTIPDRHLVRFIVDIISNRSFILKTSDGQCSRLRRLTHGVPQGSTLAPMLFNIYISAIPTPCPPNMAVLMTWPVFSQVLEWGRRSPFFGYAKNCWIPICMEAQAEHGRNYMHYVPPEQ